MELFGNRWKYINEGNVHIVLQLQDTDYAIRLIKEDVKRIDLSHVRNCVDFVNFVMLPLLASDFYVKEETVQISEKVSVQLSHELFDMRPEYRRFKSVLSPYAIKVPNLAAVSSKCKTNYCVEIKPKEGFISKDLSEYSKCYYCLKQYLKLQSREIEKVSRYCPLDLFSGKIDTMRMALINLVDNPQNNFKVFKNGMLIYNEKSEKMIFDDYIKSLPYFENTAEFLDFIIKILLREDKHTNILFEDGRENYDQCSGKHSLKPKSFLYKMLQLQKLSENIDIDLTNINQHTDYITTILNELKTENLNLSTQKDRQSFIEITNPIHLALISAVAKDCSIMISFTNDFDKNFPYIQVNDNKITYKVSVTDLEPKSIKSLVKRKQTERKLIQAYQSYNKKSRENVKVLNCSRIQPHTETRAKQLDAWQQLITEFLKANKLSTIDIRESQNNPLFNNANINRKLSQEAILTVLEYMAKTSRAAPIDKSKNVWEVYWHSLDEWGNMIYSWACNNGMNNTVCTLFELREGENTSDEEFHGLDMNVLVKALKSLQVKGKCELMEFDDHQGVKFF